MKKIVKNNIWAIFFTLIPIVGCIIVAAAQGTGMWQINPYASFWNDEVFYYKQIESMVNSGAPWGYFGYNCSAAEAGTLGAWPLTVLLPYVFMGKIFGISPYHMIVFNMVFVMVAFAVFYCLAKPSKNQTIAVAVLFITFHPTARYIMSGMAEPVLYAALIILLGFAIYFQSENYKRVSLIVCYLMVIYFALCRPWILIFIFIPAFYHLKLSIKEGVFATLISIAAFGGIYVFYIMPRCAAYLEATINLGIFSVLTQQGIVAFIKEVLYTTVVDGIALFTDYVLKFGKFYMASVVTLIILCIVVAANIVKNIVKDKTAKRYETVLGIMALFTAFCIVWAMILFYTEEQVARHSIALVICLQLLVAMYYKPHKKAVSVVLVIVLAFFGWNYSDDKGAYFLPTDEDQFGNLPIEQQVCLLTEKVDISQNNTEWDNTVAYVFPNVSTNHCYYLPKNTGISLCFENYILENYKNLQPKYLLTDYNKQNDEMFKKAGYTVLAQGDNFVLYQTR